jgi:hypothetical protein
MTDWIPRQTDIIGRVVDGIVGREVRVGGGLVMLLC